MSFDRQCELTNNLVRLSPLKKTDFESLYGVASDPLIWEQHPAKSRCEPEGFRIFFDEAMASGGAYLITDKNTNEIIGSSRFNLVNGAPDKIEIGWTFLARAYWGGIYNRAIKTLMINHAFRFVEEIIFHIDKNNLRSQKSVEKFGAEKVLNPESRNLSPRSANDLIFRLPKQKWKG